MQGCVLTINKIEEYIHELASEILALQDGGNAKRFANVIKEVFHVHKVFAEISLSRMHLFGQALALIFRCRFDTQHSIKGLVIMSQLSEVAQVLEQLNRFLNEKIFVFS